MPRSRSDQKSQPSSSIGPRHREPRGLSKFLAGDALLESLADQAPQLDIGIIERYAIS
jgi:hypothetical protein